MATNSDDIILGSPGNDLIAGLNGSDTIQSLGGDDTVTGDAQDDHLIGGTGNDDLNGGTGDDVIEGDDGDDILIGGADDDTLIGGGEADFLQGGTGFDHHFGGGEDDAFLWENGDGNDVNDGGTDFDLQTITGAEDGDIFSLNPNDVNTTSVFQRENLIPFNIQISNMEEVDVFGGGGADFFEVGNLAGTGVNNLLFDGGDGGDTLTTQALQGVSVIAFGGDGADFFYGGIEAEEFYGEAGGDHFFSGAGDDFIVGDAGNDQIFTGSGNDFIDAGDNDDTIVMGPGDDYAITGTGADRIRYDIGGGSDTVEDYQNFVDDFFLGGIGQAVVDSNADNVVNDADDLVAYDAVTDSLTFAFNATDQIQFLGVESMSVGGDIFFV
jgi:Ca2+-binding RTX toxin-like protein